MKEISQRKMFDLLLHEGIENFMCVPDSTMKYFISQGLKKKKIIDEIITDFSTVG